MYSAKGFAVGSIAALFSSFVVVAIEDSVIAAMYVVQKRAANNAERQTTATGKLLKENSISVIDSGPIEKGSLLFPLWIKVPTMITLSALFPRRQ
jgi:hypothetical protein